MAFYVLKYMLKDGSHEEKLRQALWHNFEADEFHDIWQTVKSRHLFSKDFGNSKSQTVRHYITDCIDQSIQTKSLFPCYFNPDDGKTFPLSQFYKSKFLTYEQALSFYFANNSNDLDTVSYDLRDSVQILTERKLEVEKYSKNLQLLGQLSFVDRADELYNDESFDDTDILISSYEKENDPNF